MLTKMFRRRRKYDEEFKKRAVSMSYSSERTITDVAKSLGISNSLLYKWRKKFTPVGEQTRSSLQQDELNSLHRKISDLEEENYILKKASAFFAQNQK